jgi:tRNA(Ile)-lysidine synthase
MPHHSDIYRRWASAMRRSEMFRPGERVGVAVSGGPDSVLLLEFMRQLAADMGLVVAAVHFNHHLRGEESDEDERHVGELARNFGVEFIRGEADVGRVARDKRRNLEATARELRYRFFFSLVNRGRLDKVATAHTANDQAETVLLRLVRGSGTRGLGGIYPQLDGKIVRPFLDLTRAEIEAELAKRKLESRLDSSNRDPRLRRNKVRMELLPWLERELNPEVVLLLKNLASRARDDEEFLELQAHERAHAWRAREGQAEKIAVRPLLEFPPAIARRVLRQMVSSARGSLRGISQAHIETLRRFAAEAQSGRSLVLPGNLLIRKDFSWLVITTQPAADSHEGFSCVIVPPSEVTVHQLGLVFRFKIVGAEEFQGAYNNREVLGLDTSKLRGSLTLRNWRAGDRFQPLGSRNPLKLKELFRLRKIPREQRKLWPVLECGEEIVWVRGFPVGSSAAAVPGKGEVLLIAEQPEQAASVRVEPR